jgi:hypothetical protein
MHEKIREKMNPPFHQAAGTPLRGEKTDLGLFGTKCRFQQDVGRLALFARWVFEEKFHSASPTAC